MRSLSRAALLGALATVAVAPTAMAAPSMTMKVSPNKRGTLTLGAPTTFTASFASPERAATTDGSVRLKSIAAKLPDGLVFNPLPFAQCNSVQFAATKTCPSSTKLGTAKIVADGGPDVGPVNASATLYFGTGYSVLANVTATSPALINEAVIGRLESSAAPGDSSAGYGLQMFIPVTPVIQSPLDNVYPVVKTFDATITPMKKKVKVDGVKGKYTMPIAGLGPCSKLNFAITVAYVNAQGTDLAPDTATTSQKCSK